MASARFPNETPEYRGARSALLEAEIALRAQVERVAALRRKLPPGGELKEDYAFEGPSGTVRLSELFAPGKDTLFVYGFMYGPKMERACPLCTSFLDSLNGAARHITQRLNLAVVARSPLPRILEHAKARGWDELRLLSDAGNTFHADYLAEAPDGSQLPMANVFVRRGGRIHHWWATEMLFVPCEDGDRRHVDMMWPIWHVFDTTPEGRGDWYPSLDY